MCWSIPTYALMALHIPVATAWHDWFARVVRLVHTAGTVGAAGRRSADVRHVHIYIPACLRTCILATLLSTLLSHLFTYLLTYPLTCLLTRSTYLRNLLTYLLTPLNYLTNLLNSFNCLNTRT